MARLGGLTGLLGAYLALVQVLLLARLPFLGRVAGFDRLTVWHRWNGYACLILVVAHTVLAVYGYAIDRHTGFFDQFWKLVADNFLQGMVTATIGLALFVLVVGDLDRDRPAPSQLRALVRRPLHRLRSDRARLVPRDPDRRRPRASARAQRATGGCSSSARSSCSSSAC